MVLRDVVFQDLIRTLNLFDYCILRNYESLPSFNNDIDILVNSKQTNDIINELTIELGKDGITFIRYSRFNCYSLFFYDSVDSKYFHIDLFEEISWRSFDYLDAQDILLNRIMYKTFYVPSSEHECVELLLTRLLMEKKIKAKNHHKIISLFHQSKKKNETKYPFVYKYLEKEVNESTWEFINRKWFFFRFEVIKASIRKNRLYQIIKIIKLIKRLIKRFISCPGAILTLNESQLSNKLFIQKINDKFLGMYPEKIITVSDTTSLRSLLRIKFLLFKDYLILYPLEMTNSFFDRYKINISSDADESDLDVNNAIHNYNSYFLKKNQVGK